MIEAAYLLATLLCVVVAAWYSSRWAPDALSRVLVGVVVGVSVPIGLAIVLGMSGMLSRGWLLIAHLVFALVSFIGRERLAKRASPPREARVEARTPEALASAFIGTGVAAYAVVQTVRGRPTGEADSRSYHLANLVEWFRSHRIWELPFQNLGYFTATHPGNGELLGVAALAATGGEQLAYLTPVPFGVLVVLACASVARDLGADGGRGALAALAVLAAPVSFATQANSLATDLAAAAGLIAAVACLLRERKDSDNRWLILSGVALGLGLGSKYTVFVPVAVVAVAAIFMHRRRALWLAPGLLLFSGPWFVRNAVETGNPIFPQGIELGSRELLPAGQSPLLALSTSIADHLVNMRTDVLGRWAELAARFYGPVLILVAVGVLAVLLKRSRRAPLLAVAGLTLVALAGYLFTPFTGAGENGLEFLMGSNLRYALPAVLLGAALAAATLPRILVGVLAGISIAYDGYKILRGAGFRTDLDVDAPGLALAGLAAILALIVAARGPQIARALAPRKAAVVVLGVVVAFVGLLGAVWSSDRTQSPTELEATLASIRAREVIVLGVEDLRSVLGPNLDTEMKVVAAGGEADELPFDSAADLNVALRRTDSEHLVMLPGSPAVPRGWEPDGEWRKLRSTRQGVVYARARS